MYNVIYNYMYPSTSITYPLPLNLPEKALNNIYVQLTILELCKLRTASKSFRASIYEEERYSLIIGIVKEIAAQISSKPIVEMNRKKNKHVNSDDNDIKFVLCRVPNSTDGKLHYRVVSWVWDGPLLQKLNIAANGVMGFYCHWRKYDKSTTESYMEAAQSQAEQLADKYRLTAISAKVEPLDTEYNDSEIEKGEEWVCINHGKSKIKFLYPKFLGKDNPINDYLDKRVRDASQQMIIPHNYHEIPHKIIL